MTHRGPHFFVVHKLLLLLFQELLTFIDLVRGCEGLWRNEGLTALVLSRMKTLVIGNLANLARLLSTIVFSLYIDYYVMHGLKCVITVIKGGFLTRMHILFMQMQSRNCKNQCV